MLPNLKGRRNDHAAHSLDATSHVQPIETKSWSRIGFSLFEPMRSMPQCIALKRAPQPATNIYEHRLI
jgi:hypothetical protein